MSHFTVMVITGEEGPEIEDMLEPYHELDMTQDEMKYDDRAKFSAEIPDGQLEEYFNQWKEDPKHAEALKDYKDSTEWLKKWHGFIHEPGLGYGYYRNPTSYWDWYQIGGRWPGKLRLKQKAMNSYPAIEPDDRYRKTMGVPEPDAGWVNSARVRDIDWKGMKAVAVKKAREYAEKEWNCMKEAIDTNVLVVDVLKKRDMFDALFGGNPHWPKPTEENKLDTADGSLRFLGSFFQMYPTSKSYMGVVSKDVSGLTTYAVLNSDGWFAPGRMGWFGMSSEGDDDKLTWDAEFYKRFIKPLDPEDIITIVDCHI